MTCEEIDRALAGWNGQLAAVANNLLELQGDATYRVLTGAGGGKKLSLAGETARLVEPALAAMEMLFQQFGLLGEVIDRVARLRANLPPIFGREQALKEMEGLLLGESVKLPETAVELGQRTLLSGLERARGVRPEELLGRMAGAFAGARDAVLTVGAAWDEVAAELEGTEAEVRGVRGEVDGGAMEAAQAMLARAKVEVESDPLGVRTELRTRVRPALEALLRGVRLRAGVRAQIAEGRALLQRLLRLEEELGTAAKAAREKVVTAVAAEQGGAGEKEGLEVERLGNWLDRLEGRCAGESVEALGVGLRNWGKAAEALERRETERLRVLRLPLEQRRELRGRLEALKAKARAYGLAEDVRFAGLAGAAEALLYARPTDVGRAGAAVEAYERGLSEAKTMAGQRGVGR